MRVNILFYDPNRKTSPSSPYYEHKIITENVPRIGDKIKGPGLETFIVNEVKWYPFVIAEDPFVELIANRCD